MTATQWEVFAAYGGLSVTDLGRIMGDRNLNPVTQAELLATALAMPFKETARAHYLSLLEGPGGYSVHLVRGLEWLSRLGLLGQSNANLEILPDYSFSINFTFTLSQPYLSKDDDAFYIIDNPVRKDKVFKTPYVAPSSWKGSLRHSLWQLDPQEGEQIKRLFGETRDDDTGQSGRLFFYPTFFDRIGLEIINPHDRERRVGKNPILFECVPGDAKAQFTLLYVPFDRIGNEEANPEKGIKSLPQEVAEDLTLLTKGLEALFTLYGFGAKTSSGFGLAEEQVSLGSLRLHAEDTDHKQKEDKTSADPLAVIQPDIDDFLNRFGLDAFPRWTNQELSGSGWGGKRQSDYKRLRSRHPDWEEDAGQWRVAVAPQAAAEPIASPPLTERTFSTFAELLTLSQNLAASLTPGGNA